ncbi:MAG: aminotransferase class IV [Gemmatimonadales bacterium]
MSVASSTVLLETVRVRDGSVPLWPYHRARLERSCFEVGILSPPRMEVPVGEDDLVCRFEISRDGVRCSSRPAGPAHPVRIVTARTVHEPYPHKTTARDCFDRAAEEATVAGAGEAILLTPEGAVAEGTSFAILWWEMNLLCAPPLRLGILPSVGRARVKDLAHWIQEKRVRRRELAGRPVLLVNAVRGIVEVASWDGHPVPRHPQTARLVEAFWP